MEYTNNLAYEAMGLKPIGDGEVTDTIRHTQLLKKIHDTYVQKNAAYGDSFHQTYADLGIMSAITRISDKYNRVKTLAKNHDVDTGDESIIDTLLDMANYCIMTVMELEKNDT